MTPTSRSKAQPAGRRAKPGSTGEGDFYHIEVRPKTDFLTFRNQDVGRKGGIERVAGKRSTGSWDTQTWLIGKELAHVEDGRLVPDSEAARKVLAELGSKPVPVGGDRFKAAPRPKVRESKKPTHEEIARCAYLIYESRSRGHGRDLKDWLEAEMQWIADRNQEVETDPQKKQQ